MNHYTFFMLKPSTLRNKTGGLFGKPLAEEIISFIKKQGFQIVEQKIVGLSRTDLLRVYGEELKKAKGIDRNLALFLLNEQKNTIQNGKVMLLLTYHPTKDAIALGTEIKGDNFNPAKCRHDTIRYIFRDKSWDAVVMKPGKYINAPTDNVVHCPDCKAEFDPVVRKFFPDKLKLISK